MSKKNAGRGRPKIKASKVADCRHVLNINSELDSAVRKFADLNGCAKLTDALRQMLTFAAKEKGLM